MILNAPNEKIMFLWIFQDFFFRNHYLEDGFTFQWGLLDGVIGMMRGVLKKMIGLGGTPCTPNALSTLGHPEKSLCNLLKHILNKLNLRWLFHLIQTIYVFFLMIQGTVSGATFPK